MMDKGHCKIDMDSGDSLAEFGDFYDYTSSYPEGENPDTEVEDSELNVNDVMELVLPSGAKVGHRSLAIYFKQNLREKPLGDNDQKKIKNKHSELMSQYQAVGNYGFTPIAVLKQKARDQQFLAKRRLKIGLKANKLQPHFRCQILI